MATLAIAGKARPVSAEHRFFAGLALAMLVAVLVGFAPSYYWRSADRPALSLLLALHGAVFTAFMLLFVLQTQLVLWSRTAWHRRLGIAGALLLALMVLLGTAVGVAQAAEGRSPPGVGALPWLAWVLGDVVSFAGLIGASLWLRRNGPAHKRLMVLGVAVMMGPALGRAAPAFGLPGIAGAIGGPWLFALALLIWDVTSRGRPHMATSWGCAFFAITMFGRIPLIDSPAWPPVAEGIVRTFA